MPQVPQMFQKITIWGLTLGSFKFHRPCPMMSLSLSPHLSLSISMICALKNQCVSFMCSIPLSHFISLFVCVFVLLYFSISLIVVYPSSYYLLSFFLLPPGTSFFLLMFTWVCTIYHACQTLAFIEVRFGNTQCPRAALS